METQPDRTRVLTHRKSASRFYLSGAAARSGGQLFTLHESFSSDDSAPELVEDDRPESASSFEDDEFQYHASAAELWDSFWHGGGKAQRCDGMRWSVRKEEAAPAFPFRGLPAARRHSDKGPEEVALAEEHGFQRDWDRSESPTNYFLFPRPPQTPPRAPAFANPFPPSPTSPANPPALHTSKSTTHLPRAPTSPPPSPPRRSPAKRKPAPLHLHRPLDRPTTPHKRTPSDLDAPVSPKSRTPAKPRSANAAIPYLNRPLPPIPAAPLTNPDPQPTSFFDDSDDEGGSPGLAARIKGKFAHRRAISGGREEEEAGKGGVFARMLRRSRP